MSKHLTSAHSSFLSAEAGQGGHLGGSKMQSIELIFGICVILKHSSTPPPFLKNSSLSHKGGKARWASAVGRQGVGRYRGPQPGRQSQVAQGDNSGRGRRRGRGLLASRETEEVRK